MQVIKTVPTPDNEVDDEGRIRDEKDRPILRAARKAKVSLLLTGDLDFLESDITDPEIISAADFINKNR